MGAVEPSLRSRRARLRTPLATAVAVILATLLPAWSAAPAHADATVKFTISDPAITESSGLAADRDDGLYWTVNDSGDSGRVFALEPSGTVRGTVNFRAEPVDVEAVGYHDGAVYIADIGDNDANRNYVTVYVLYDTEPNNATVLYHAYDFAYPDGSHDAETMLITDAGRIFFVTKDKVGGIYEAPAEPSRSQVNTLIRVADAPAYVTDGTVLDDGRFALRSYVDVKIVDPSDDYRVVAQAPTPFQPQGESVTQDLDGSALLLGSEGKQSAVYAMPVPEKITDVPAAGSTPPTESATPTPSRSTSASSSSRPADEQATDSGGGSGGRGGTTVAVLLAALVAVAAGAGVYLLRGRSQT